MQAQEGVLKPPKQHALVQSYSFDNLPLIAMNVARIGAQTPSMAREVGAEAPIGKGTETKRGKDQGPER